MASENNFQSTVESLFKGMDSFITTKTVVGDAITVGDTILLPLVDVSFGVGAGAFSGDKKNNGGGIKVTDYLTSIRRCLCSFGEFAEYALRPQA